MAPAMLILGCDIAWKNDMAGDELKPTCRVDTFWIEAKTETKSRVSSQATNPLPKNLENSSKKCPPLFAPPLRGTCNETME